MRASNAYYSSLQVRLIILWRFNLAINHPSHHMCALPMAVRTANLPDGFVLGLIFHYTTSSQS